MNEVIKTIPTSGIVSPGEVYIFDERPDRAHSPDPIKYLYVIKREEEILPALEMEFCIVLAGEYELRQFLGWRKISADCQECKLICYDKVEETEVDYFLYLHRIMTFEEKLARVKELFLGMDPF